MVLPLISVNECVGGYVHSLNLSITGIFRILANHIGPQNFVASLYGKFRAEKLLYKEVTEL